MAPATVKLTVALMVMPWAVASSMAMRPATVTGSLTCRFGARPAKWSAYSTLAGASLDRTGFTWIDR